MIDQILSIIKKEYRVRSLNAGVFHKLVIQGMDFSVNSYEAADLGRVAVMHASGLLGLMKRDTLIINPLEKAAPIVTYERIKAFGKDAYIIVKYNMEHPIEKVEKEGKKKQTAQFDAEIEQYMKDYMEEIKTSTNCKTSDRKREVKALVDQMIVENKLSSDIFLANYGEEITDKLYYEVMFGIK